MYSRNKFTRSSKKNKHAAIYNSDFAYIDVRAFVGFPSEGFYAHTPREGFQHQNKLKKNKEVGYFQV